MAAKVRIYLDSSALFAGIWSEVGGARLIFKLGEAGAIQLLISSQVLFESENALRAKAPETLGQLAVFLDRSAIKVLPPASPEQVEACKRFTQHAGDAHVLASAWESGVDFFVTLDQKHFLNNTLLHDESPFLIGTPGDFLAWFRSQLL